MNGIQAYAAGGMYGNIGIGPASGTTALSQGTGKVGSENLKVNGTECQTCKNRKYQDGSDEMVSFKSAAHISPQAAAGRIRAHEQEHVANAYDEAFQKDGKVLNASVSLKTAICPECGRSYVAGGLTRTTIRYSNESNPYQKNMKSAHRAALTGMNFDKGV